MYERDIIPLWEKHIDVKDRIRETIYPLLYDRPYLFSTTKSNEPIDYGADDVPPGTRPDGPSPGQAGDNREVKPFMPVSSEEDLMKVLNKSMG